MYNIIYIHKNDSFYLDDVLNITVNANRSHRIIFIGDEYNKKYSDKYNIEFYYLRDYYEDFNYNHISVNTIDYEKFCFMRWIVLSNFIKMHNIVGKIVYCDSDNVILQDLNKIDVINKYDISYLGNNDVCVPNLLICKSDVIHLIKDYILKFYNRTYDDIYNSIMKIKHFENGKLHYSDMWLIRDVFKNISNEDNIIFNTYYDKDRYSIINLERIDNSIYIFTADYSQIIGVDKSKLVNIHFNGHNKSNIREYV